MVEGGLRLMTRVWRGRAGKVKSSSGWMISATSSPCQPFPLLDCTMWSGGTSNIVSCVISSKGACSTPCLPSCGQKEAADTGVIPSSLRFYHRASSSRNNTAQEYGRISPRARARVSREQFLHGNDQVRCGRMRDHPGAKRRWRGNTLSRLDRGCIARRTDFVVRPSSTKTTRAPDLCHSFPRTKGGGKRSDPAEVKPPFHSYTTRWRASCAGYLGHLFAK